MGICEGRVCVVTGAGRGIGRAYALTLASEGACVVVNDLGGEMDGTGNPTSGPATEVVEEIRAAGGEAVANGDDVASFDGAERLVRTAVDTFGDLHCLVNNAGILRDRMLVNMTEAEWDDVVRVHLKGTFAPTHHAANHWREQTKAAEAGERDRPVARVINTTSVSGIYGNVGQTNYGAAKAGIASFTFIASMELARYGATVNAIAPVALTRLTEGLGPERTEEQREAMDPRWIAPVVTWLASEESSHVTGRVFEASGRVLAVAEGWHRGPAADPVEDPAAIGPVVDDLLSRARPPADMEGKDRQV
ncbi:SDR family oxidoreductase [Dermatobacter hominis]|uniref:SDR family oxidoreductase n=1 Tax=Dermatobacter hominis TaxID=2884263 RepID=UPI001D1272F9|nr:SDR family oxidoreductase [Dermatobacter hominis]UDY36936.1 SDR family NAD(P)-dependent oxidoreductase [Dermatobacter hominis]